MFNQEGYLRRALFDLNVGSCTRLTTRCSASLLRVLESLATSCSDSLRTPEVFLSDRQTFNLIIAKWTSRALITHSFVRLQGTTAAQIYSLQRVLIETTALWLSLNDSSAEGLLGVRRGERVCFYRTCTLSMCNILHVISMVNVWPYILMDWSAAICNK